MKTYKHYTIVLLIASIFFFNCSGAADDKSKVVDTYSCTFEIENLKEIGDKNLDIISGVMDVSGVIKVNEDVRMNTVFVVYNHNETDAKSIASKIEKINDAVYKVNLIEDNPVDIQPKKEGLDAEEEGEGVSV